MMYSYHILYYTSDDTGLACMHVHNIILVFLKYNVIVTKKTTDLSLIVVLAVLRLD